MRGAILIGVVAAGSAILIPPGGGSRLPWKSLIARTRTSIGCAAVAGVIAAVSANTAAVSNRQDRLIEKRCIIESDDEDP